MAEKQGLNIMTPCPGCGGTLKKLNKILKADKILREQINVHLAKSGLEFKGNVEAKQILQVLKEDVGAEKIKASIVRPLTRLKVPGTTAARS